MFTNNHKIIKVKNPTTAGTTNVVSDAVDMAQDGGYDGVCFFTSFGTAAANNTIKASQCDTETGTYADLKDTAVAVGTSDENVWLDILYSRERYVKVTAMRGTSTTCGDIWAILYNAHRAPVDNIVTGTIAGEQHIAPVEGTA